MGWCDDCGKEWGNMGNARQKAYSHAKRTGHHVHCEVGVNHNYYFPKKNK